MVVSASVSGTGAVKRPASSMHDDYTGWETAPAMDVTMRTSFNLPYTHYAMIYLDNLGRLKVQESSSIRETNGTVFTPDVQDKFLEILGAKIGYRRPTMRKFSGMGASLYGYPRPEDYSRHVKRRKASFQEHAIEPHFPEPVEEVPASTSMVGIEIGDTEKILEYYENALKHFQQLNCRQIAKAFIKFIEPRKQVKHPYNGGKPRAGAASGEKGDPEKTKPEWWPAGVVHKEPDHLRKEQRIRLLIHIVRKLGKFGITPDKLQEVAHDSKRQLRPTSKIEVLDEVFKVRRMEERYELGEVDANCLVYVQNRDASAKDKDSDTISEPEQKFEPEDLEEADDEFLTPPSSAEQASSFTSSVDMTMGGHGRPMHMGGDRGQLFPLPESLSFGEQSTHERSYYGNSEYPDEYSHPILKTPVTSGLVTPNEQPNAFDYLQAPFSASTTGEPIISHQRPTALPMQQSVSQFDSWTPSYRQSMFNPMEYGSAPAQNIPQHMPYHMPVATTSHAAELAHTPHGLPKGNPFRTGSLSHPHMIPHHA
ncbi:Protein of unknown function DUF2841 [Aspergillus parasiticus SU-1]|uniref:Subtelomeric hrmA-associated cluster protein AFUB-079030/YDR124W-like helical bundle domain-containing protein n=2 Tax=Aspergillus subgen. Circumdati TaxID=2720871 RepID=A0A2G7G5A4_9EURO|nr:Protein of unknown function DUF2841 [Aspergillus parasiticus SU-1]PIG87775.1 hypothetical protein AARAC_000803 [Aspergillus arachidicola]